MLKFQFLNKLEYIIRRHKDIRPKYIISYNNCDVSYAYWPDNLKHESLNIGIILTEIRPLI